MMDTTEMRYGKCRNQCQSFFNFHVQAAQLHFLNSLSAQSKRLCMQCKNKSSLHVFVCLRFSWRYQLREFKSEFRVVAIDMRGYGESDLPLSPESYRFDYLVTDIKDIVEYLGERDTGCTVLLDIF